MGIPVGLLIRIGLALAVMAALAWGWHLFTKHYEDIGRAEIQTKWDADIAVRNKAIADQTRLWDAQRIKTEVAEHERDEARSKLFAQVPTLPPAIARERVPAAFVGVLRDNTRAANLAGGTGEPDQAPPTAPAPADAESDLGLLAQWFSDVARIHAECRDRVAEWVTFYNGLRAAQP